MVPHSSATTNQCLGSSYVLIIIWYLGAPFIEIISFGALLSLCAVNVRFRVICFGFWVTSSCFLVTFYVGFSLLKLTHPNCLLSICVLDKVICNGLITLVCELGICFVKYSVILSFLGFQCIYK